MTAAVTKEAEFYVARCLEVEVTSQGETLDESLSNLREALELYYANEVDSEVPNSPIIAPVDIEVEL